LECKIKNKNEIVWAHFKSERRVNPKDSAEHETEKKTSKRETDIKMGTAG
jgi:hypothetical protein